MKYIAIALLMLVTATTVQAKNIWLSSKVNSPVTGAVEWGQPSTDVDEWEVSAYPWLNFPPLRSSATPAAPVLRVANGNIWTGGCKDVKRYIQSWLSAMHMGGIIS